MSTLGTSLALLSRSIGANRVNTSPFEKETKGNRKLLAIIPLSKRAFLS